jgi:protein tyrosine phosphatase (PTP) superfamily phosphohydrolase (DUF442 family)
MPRTVIACYRPKPGKQDALDALARTHFARLYEQGLVTRRRPIMMRARDGTLLEVFEWKSQRAIDEAHTNPAVLAMWNEYSEVCDYVPVGSLAEAGELFSGFDSLGLDPVVPKVSRIFNHVQVEARIATSGALTAQAVADIAEAGYGRVIDLLPQDNPQALPDERALARRHGLAYHHIPVAFDAPTAADFEAFVQAMQSPGGTGESSEKIWVHCAANLRVTAFMALYGQRCMGWTKERARELIAEVWQPNPVWQAFLDAQAKDADQE